MANVWLTHDGQMGSSAGWIIGTITRMITPKKRMYIKSISVPIANNSATRGLKAVIYLGSDSDYKVAESEIINIPPGSGIYTFDFPNIELSDGQPYRIGFYASLYNVGKLSLYVNNKVGDTSFVDYTLHDKTYFQGGTDSDINPNNTNDYDACIGIEYVTNTAPTTPGAFTNPLSGSILKGGESVTVTWGESSDAQGDTITYYPQYSVNGESSWTNLSIGTSRTRTVTIPKGASSIQFRVRAYDGALYSGYRTSAVYTVVNNTAPTLTLDSADNKTLSESTGQNEILVEGSTSDVDQGNAVTVKVQINNGTIRNITSAVSDGSTPIPFSKQLTYSDQRIYDGDTPITNALSEGVDHTLKVWSEDDQGGKSEVEERKFRVIHNRPPVISDTDRDLGTLIQSPSVTYQVHDLEGHAVTVTEKINGQVVRSFEAEPNTDYELEIPLDMWIPLQQEQHTLTVEATDSTGLKSTRTYTFTREEDTILLELKNPFITDVAATRILVTPEAYVPIGASIIIEACNNAFDDEPAWEDITSMAMANRGYNFVNTTKTAEDWGINIRFILEKGTATQEVRLDGFGGAFE